MASRRAFTTLAAPLAAAPRAGAAARLSLRQYNAARPVAWQQLARTSPLFSKTTNAARTGARQYSSEKPAAGDKPPHKIWNFEAVCLFGGF